MKLALANVLCSCVINVLCVFAFPHANSQVASAPSDPKQNAQLLKPEAIQGCYDVSMSPWSPDMKLGEDEVFITPPRRVQLFAERGTAGWESHGYIVRPAPGIEPSIHRGAYWLPKGPKSLEIVWTTGLSGLVMTLKTSDAEVLKGKAVTFWDFSRKKQTADVVAHRVACGKP